MHFTGFKNGGRSGRTGARFGSAVASVLLSLLAVICVATPAQASTSVKISRIYYNSPGTDTRTNASLNAEYVNITNISSVTRVITGWTIRDAANHIYKFPSTSIPAGRTVTLHTGKGTNSGYQRYWQSGAYIWNNDKDTAYLRNAAGAAIFTCSYNSTAVAYKNCRPAIRRPGLRRRPSVDGALLALPVGLAQLSLEHLAGGRQR
jgi:hypothetical protein